MRPEIQKLLVWHGITDFTIHEQWSPHGPQVILETDHSLPENFVEEFERVISTDNSGMRFPVEFIYCKKGIQY